MNTWTDSLVDGGVQCFGCGIFDRLFSVISSAAAAVYHEFSLFCILIFCIILAFYILKSVWNNIKGGMADPMYQKSVKPVLINSLFVFALLGLGVFLPRMITTLTFEPVAEITLLYTQNMLQTDTTTVEKKIVYKNLPMADDGFFRPQLRDKVILLMKTTITQFQGYIKLGFAIMDNAFSWGAFKGVGSLIKHIMMFAMGLYLAFGFFKLFIRFCFYFIDIIVAMTFFAFFFPLSIVMFAFKNSDADEWIKKLGSSLGADQFKKVINAIISLAAAVITYTVIMVIIAKFFSASGTSSNDLMTMITSGNIYSMDLSDDNLGMMTLSGCVILVYIINFLTSQIPQVTKSILSAFNVEQDTKLGDELTDNAFKLTGTAFNKAKDIGKIILGTAPDKKDEKKEDKKETKKPENK